MEVYHIMLLYTTLQWREDTTRNGIANDNIISRAASTTSREDGLLFDRIFVSIDYYYYTVVERLSLYVYIYVYITNNVYIRRLPEAHTRVFFRAQTRHPHLSTLRNGKHFIGP